MDEGRFENPKIISGGSGGFANSNRTMPSDGVSKPGTPSILERFRSLMKEREDELRVSGDEADSLSTDEVVRLYEAVLSDLTFNSKPVITDLTIIAGEQKIHGKGIADAICARILEVPVEQKLPSLYLLDSIVKNIGREYVTHFAAHLAQVFCEAHRQVDPRMHPAMRHLFGTWSSVFPSSVLRKIEACLRLSPSSNNQSSSLTSLRASESPRPTHGIHVNPKYLEARRQFSNTTSDSVGAERLSSSGHGLAASARTSRSSTPYQAKHGRSVSPSVDDFALDDSPVRVADKASPSHTVLDHGFSKVLGRQEQISDWQKNVLPDDLGRRFETSGGYRYNNGVNLDRPRALIDAYGIDEREKSNYKHLKGDQPNVNGIHKNMPLKTWQNTEEEEFNWEDMSPALGDSGRSNDLFPSSIPFPANFRSRPGPGTQLGASLVTTNFRCKLSNGQLPVYNDSYANEDVSAISSGPGGIGRLAGFPNENIQLPSTHFTQEGFNLHKSLPQSSQHAFSVKGVGRNHQMSFSAPLVEQKPHLIGNFQNIDEQSRGSSALLSKISSSSLDTLAPEMQPAGSASTGAWPPVHVHNRLHSLSGQTHEKIGYQPATVAQQGPIKPSFPLQQLDTLDSNKQTIVPQFSSQKHLISLSQQFRPQINLLQLQPRPLHEAGQNIVPASVSASSNLVRPSLNQGYIPAQGHGALVGTVGQNSIPNVPLSVPTTNTSFQLSGALPPMPRGLTPLSTPMLSISQNQGPIGPNNPPTGGALSGLFNTLMAQGVISLTNQASSAQDSVGLEFNQDLLKVRHESAITALYADLPRQCTTCGLRFKCQEAHSSHMDWHVTRNRISKNRKQKPSRKWFVNVSMWLSSAEALGTDAVPGFLPIENAVENNDEEEMAVPADDDQTACALCGEPFDDFYSDDTEEWMYKGAVYMNAPSGLMPGMDRSQLGPIVHAKCRSETSGVSSEDNRRNEGGYTDDGNERKRLRS